jgi:hypothetical protein
MVSSASFAEEPLLMVLSLKSITFLLFHEVENQLIVILGLCAVNVIKGKKRKSNELAD